MLMTGREREKENCIGMACAKATGAYSGKIRARQSDLNRAFTLNGIRLRILYILTLLFPSIYWNFLAFVLGIWKKRLNASIFTMLTGKVCVHTHTRDKDESDTPPTTQITNITKGIKWRFCFAVSFLLAKIGYKCACVWRVYLWLFLVCI